MSARCLMSQCLYRLMVSFGLRHHSGTSFASIVALLHSAATVSAGMGVLTPPRLDDPDCELVLYRRVTSVIYRLSLQVLAGRTLDEQRILRKCLLEDVQQTCILRSFGNKLY